MAAGLVMAATQAGLGHSGNVVIAAAMLFASSAAWALFNMAAVTMRQRQVPDRLLGRVTSLYGTITRGHQLPLPGLTLASREGLHRAGQSTAPAGAVRGLSSARRLEQCAPA
jgi:hypothetical protein